jgi:hypothetical protein
MAKKQLIEGEDFYINENGKYVFTENFHLKRGYCCNNNCKHCPYKSKENENNFKKEIN